MKKEDVNMDKMFRDKLEGVTAEPPSHVWDNIKGLLAYQRRKRRLVIARWISAAAVVILAFLAGWYFNEKSGQLVPATVENQVTTQQETAPQPENKETKKQIKKNNQESETIKPVVTAETTVKSDVSLTAVAGNLQTKISQPENVPVASVEKFSMKILERKMAVIPNEPTESSLKEGKEITVTDRLSEKEKALIAENVQRYSGSSEKGENWKLGLSVSPGYASQVTSHSDNYARNMTYANDQGNGNVSGGISVQYKTGKKWSIESGIYYAQNGQRSSNSPPEADYSNSFSGPHFEAEKSYFNTAVNMVNGKMAMNSTAGVIKFSHTPRGAEVATGLDNAFAGSATLVTRGDFSQVFDFIEIPLYVRYSVVDTKIGVQILGGVNAGIVAGNNVFMENSQGSQNVGKTQDISTLNVLGTVGFGVNYALSRHISMGVEPRLNYFLNSINKNPEVMFRPWRVGVYTGLYYQF